MVGAAVRVEHIGDATLMLGDCLEILPTLPRYFDIACERIDNAYRQQRMFA